MRKPIFESEEEAKKIIETIFGTQFGFVEQDGKIYIDRLKDNGFIKKSPVDEAEEMYNFVTGIENIDGTTIKSELECFKHICEKRLKAVIKQNEATQYLKNKLNEDMPCQ